MTLWKARVDCYRKGVAVPMIRRFVVEAPLAIDALQIAAKQAEDTALFGPKWTAFEVREVARVTLPLEL